MKLLRVCVVLCAAAAAARAQSPVMFPWWEGPIVRDLGLTEAQRKQILQTVDDSRDRMAGLRTAAVNAENALRDEMNAAQVDARKTEEAIEKVIVARGDLTRAISQLSLKLRLVLTPEQWRELQKRQPPPRGMRGPGPDWRGPHDSSRPRPPDRRP
jgi:Spy/CpxP family protein refolding chaperone